MFFKSKDKEASQIKMFEEKLPIIKDMESVRGKDFKIAMHYIGMPIDFCYMGVFVKTGGIEGVRQFIEKLDEYIKSPEDVKTLVHLNEKDNNLLGMMDRHEEQTSNIKTKRMLNIVEPSEFNSVKKLLKTRNKEWDTMHDLHLEFLNSIDDYQIKCRRKMYEIFEEAVAV